MVDQSSILPTSYDVSELVDMIDEEKKSINNILE